MWRFKFRLRALKMRSERSMMQSGLGNSSSQEMTSPLVPSLVDRYPTGCFATLHKQDILILQRHVWKTRCVRDMRSVRSVNRNRSLRK
jgi:hypothetical protein